MKKAKGKLVSGMSGILKVLDASASQYFSQEIFAKTHITKIYF
jgi:hypothetical protein